MPANKKYLTKSPWVRLSRILAGTAGGYAVMVSFHYCLTYVFPQEDVIATAFFTGYILWAFLLLWAFLETKVWRLYATYVGLTLLFALPYLFKLT